MKKTGRFRADRRESIIEAAKELFQSKEYEKSTMQDVMDALDIAKGTIYHYFPSKEALLEAVVENIVAASIDRMKTVVETTPGTALEKIKILIQTGNVSSENSTILQELHQPKNSGMHTKILASMVTKQAALYKQLIEQGCKEGVFKTENPLECAEFILAGTQFLTDTAIYPWTPYDLHRRAQAAPKLFEQFLKAPAGSFDFMAQAVQKK